MKQIQDQRFPGYDGEEDDIRLRQYDLSNNEQIMSAQQEENFASFETEVKEVEYGENIGNEVNADYLETSEVLPYFLQKIGLSSVYWNNESCVSDIEGNNEVEDFPKLNIDFLKKNSSSRITVEINNMKITALIDTGADVTALPFRTWRRITSDVSNPILNSVREMELVDFTGKKKKSIKGVTTVAVQLSNIEVTMKILVVQEMNEDLILGLDFLTQLQALINFKNKTLTITSEEQSAVLDLLPAEIDDSNLQIDRLSWNTREMDDIRKDEKNMHIEEDLHRAVIAANGLSQKQKEELFQVLHRCKKTFSDLPGCCNVYEHSFEVDTSEPMVRKPYPIPQAYMEEVRRQVRELEENGIIRLSQSVHLNPLLVVPKKNKRIRICVDLRTPNSHIRLPQIRPPRIEDVLIQVNNKKFISTLDFLSSFHQLKMSEVCKPFTAFYVDGTLYEFERVPFGLKSASSALNACLSKIFGSEFKAVLLNYVDDVVIFSESFEEHMEVLEKVLKRIEEVGMTLNLEKCEFCRKEV